MLHRNNFNLYTEVPMSTMTQTESPTYSFATPDDVKQLSQKALNIWVGAMSPLWAPFWAASSFGLGVWALTQSLTKAEGLRDLPLASQWPGFSGTWAKEALQVVADPVAAATEVVEPVAETVSEAVAEAPTKAVEAVEAVAEEPAKAVEAVETAAAEVVAEATPLIDPVTEVPVVPEVVESIAEAPAVAELAEPVVEAVEVAAAKPVTPKAIAQSVSAVKTVTKPKTAKTPATKA